MEISVKFKFNMEKSVESTRLQESYNLKQALQTQT